MSFAADATIKLNRLNPASVLEISRQQAELSRWMSGNQDQTAKKAGWPHNLVGRGGEPIRWSPAISRVPEGLSVDAEAAWLGVSRLHNSEQLLLAARLFVYTKNKQYLSWIDRQLIAYARDYDRLPLSSNNGSSRLFSQGLDEAVWLLNIVKALSTVESSGLVEPAHFDSVKNTLIRASAETLLLSDAAPLSNVQVWLRAAAVSAALITDQAAIATRARSGKNGLDALMIGGVDKQGYWAEGSSAYNSFVLEALLGLITVDTDSEVCGYRSTCFDSVLAMAAAGYGRSYLDLSSPAIGDSQVGKPALSRKVLDEGWEILFSCVLDGRVVGPALLFEATRSCRDFPGGASKLLSSWRKAADSQPVYFLERNSVSVALIAAHSDGRLHSHLDFLNFEAKLGDSWVFRDLGRGLYSDPIDAELKRKLGHSIIYFDGEPLVPEAGKYVFERSPNAVSIEGRRGSLRFKRRVSILDARKAAFEVETSIKNEAGPGFAAFPFFSKCLFRFDGPAPMGIGDRALVLRSLKNTFASDFSSQRNVHSDVHSVSGECLVQGSRVRVDISSPNAFSLSSASVDGLFRDAAAAGLFWVYFRGDSFAFKVRFSLL